MGAERGNRGTKNVSGDVTNGAGAEVSRPPRGTELGKTPRVLAAPRRTQSGLRH